MSLAWITGGSSRIFSSTAFDTMSKTSIIQPVKPVVESLESWMVCTVRGTASQSSLDDPDLSFSALANPFSSSSILDCRTFMDDFFSDSEADDLRDPLACLSQGHKFSGLW